MLFQRENSSPAFRQVRVRDNRALVHVAARCGIYGKLEEENIECLLPPYRNIHAAFPRNPCGRRYNEVTSLSRFNKKSTPATAPERRFEISFATISPQRPQIRMPPSWIMVCTTDVLMLNIAYSRRNRCEIARRPRCSWHMRAW